jgi:uncharacterized protein (TIGR02466 family)
MIEVKKIFSDFIATSDLNDVIDVNKIKIDFLDYIDNHDNKSNIKISNEGGYHSNNISYDIIMNSYPTLNSLYNILSNYTKSLLSKDHIAIDNSWINISKKYNYNNLHMHPNSVISGVFYIDTPKNCGDIVFYRERSFIDYNLSHHFSNINDYEIKSEIYSLTPFTGQMILFPSNMYHMVKPNKSNKSRISLAFNTREQI